MLTVFHVGMMTLDCDWDYNSDAVDSLLCYTQFICTNFRMRLPWTDVSPNALFEAHKLYVRVIAKNQSLFLFAPLKELNLVKIRSSLCRKLFDRYDVFQLSRKRKHNGITY